MFHELPQDASEDKINSFIQLSSAFVKQVYSAKPKEQILVPEASCKATMKHLLEYLYCDKFVEKKLISEVRNVVQLCGQLGLLKIQKMIHILVENQRVKIINNILKATMKEENINPEQNRPVPQKVKQLADEWEGKIYLDFSLDEEDLV